MSRAIIYPYKVKRLQKLMAAATGSIHQEPGSQRIGKHSVTFTRRGGLITDCVPLSEDGHVSGLAVVRCIHGIQWSAGDKGMNTCNECLQATKAVQRIHMAAAL